MEQADYKTQLLAELKKHTNVAVERINQILVLIPPKATELTLDIFPNQDGDGLFDVRAGLNGPDLYVLGQSIHEVADIFVTKHGVGQIEPPIPYVDQDDLDWEVNETLSQVVIEWLTDIWNENFTEVKIPTTIIVADDFTEIDAVELN